MTTPPIIAVTSGEPAGIGPEIVAMLAERQHDRRWPARIVVLGDKHLLEERATRIGRAARYIDFDARSAPRYGGAIEVWNHPVLVPVVAGHLDPANAAHVIDLLAHASDACATGEFSALVTAPVQKSTLQDAGYTFSGHTEFLAQRTHTPRVVMMLVGGADAQALRVALVTTHLPLHDVPRAITRAAVDETIAIVVQELRGNFAIAKPRIAVCGLNPHAGEGGHLGHEEIDIIAPAIAAAKANGIDVVGPLPADTVFIPDHARAYDAIVAMYHDQGLPVLKAASFGRGINITLGLPFIRTSVDHGTALDLAVDADRARSADPGSLVSAFELALELATRRSA
jgi:4-hydroxythreonine-4-phosphate dehydrogenase